MTISGELEILPENSEKLVRLHEVKVVPNIRNNIVSGGILLQDEYEM